MKFGHNISTEKKIRREIMTKNQEKLYPNFYGHNFSEKLWPNKPGNYIQLKMDTISPFIVFVNTREEKIQNCVEFFYCILAISARFARLDVYWNELIVIHNDLSGASRLGSLRSPRRSTPFIFCGYMK